MTTTTTNFGAYDAHQSESKQAQWRADKWMIGGTLLMGTGVLGVFGLPLFFYGLRQQTLAAKAGLSVRPMIVTLIGYLVIIDSSLNSLGWAMDLFANHSADQPGSHRVGGARSLMAVTSGTTTNSRWALMRSAALARPAKKPGKYR